MKWILPFLLFFFRLQASWAQVDSTQTADTTYQHEWRVKVLNYRLSGRTASGLHTKKIKEPFVAVSRDLLSVLPIGSYLQLSNCFWAGTYKVLDKMGKRHSNTLDVYSKKKNVGVQYCTCKPLEAP